jgi:hypothetical protein
VFTPSSRVLNHHYARPASASTPPGKPGSLIPPVTAPTDLRPRLANPGISHRTRLHAHRADFFAAAQYACSIGERSRLQFTGFAKIVLRLQIPCPRHPRRFRSIRPLFDDCKNRLQLFTGPRISFARLLSRLWMSFAVPGKSNRKKKIRHDKEAYKKRTVVERCFCRLKDFGRIATRYDKLASNFVSAVCFVATHFISMNITK